MLEILKNAAEEGGKVLLNYFRSEQLDVQHKTSHQNIVTQADTESQEKVMHTLIDGMKTAGIDADEIGFIGEESLDKKGTHTFIIDPLDGTSNFASKLDLFVLPIAYLKEGVLKASIVYRPVNGDIYVAEKGKGAYLTRDGKKLRLEYKKNGTHNGLIGVESGLKNGDKNSMRGVLGELLTHYRGMRILGAAALDLAYVAENAFQVAIIESCRVWDFAASQLLIEEAGGNLYDFDGNEAKIDLDNGDAPYNIIACHADQKDFIVSILNK